MPAITVAGMIVFVVDSRIGALDRTLGFLFGAARGVLIILIGVIFAQWLLPDILKTYAGDLCNRNCLRCTDPDLYRKFVDDDGE